MATPSVTAAAAAAAPEAATGTAWVGGQLPSPWAGGPAASVSARAQFTQALEQAEGLVSGAARRPAARGSGVWDFGLSDVERMGRRLSAADAEFSRRVQGISSLDPTSPTLPAELLSVSLTAAKGSVESTLATRFVSKINEGLNTLLKAS